MGGETPHIHFLAESQPRVGVVGGERTLGLDRAGRVTLDEGEVSVALAQAERQPREPTPARNVRPEEPARHAPVNAQVVLASIETAGRESAPRRPRGLPLLAPGARLEGAHEQQFTTRHRPGLASGIGPDESSESAGRVFPVLRSNRLSGQGERLPVDREVRATALHPAPDRIHRLGGDGPPEARQPCLRHGTGIVDGARRFVVGNGDQVLVVLAAVGVVQPCLGEFDNHGLTVVIDHVVEEPDADLVIGRPRRKGQQVLSRAEVRTRGGSPFRGCPEVDFHPER